MDRQGEDMLSWTEAWERARKSLDGVTRRRVQGSRRDVEIALLDWGGDGDLVVMHHANGFCGATLAPIACALRDRYRVVTLDARGQGDSTSIATDDAPDAYAWEALAADLRTSVHQILEFVGCERVELGIGHSFGGALMLSVAELEPALFSRLLLCDPVIIEAGPDEAPGPPPRGPNLATGALKRRSRFPSRAEAFEHFRGRGIFADFTAEALALYVAEAIAPTPDGDLALKCRPEVEAAIFSGAALSGLFANAHSASAEIRLVHAERGNFSRARYDALAACLPNATVQGLDGGHLFPMETPERVLEIVDEMMPAAR